MASLREGAAKAKVERERAKKQAAKVNGGARGNAKKCSAESLEELQSMIDQVNLLEVVMEDGGVPIREAGERTVFNPCPICGHNDCFKVYPDNRWVCFSEEHAKKFPPRDGKKPGGNVLNYLEEKNGWDGRQRIDWLRQRTGNPRKHQAKGESEPASSGKRPRLKGQVNMYECVTRYYRNGKKGGSIWHDKVAKDLIRNNLVCKVNGAPAIWNGKRYELGLEPIEAATLKIIDASSSHQRAEVIRYLMLTAPEREAARPSLVAFSNGALDTETGRMHQFTHKEVITNVIPHAYDPAAYDETLDRFLDSVSSGNAAVRAALEEVLGVSLYRSSEFGQAAILLGSGSNGKSTYIKALKYALGEENYSVLDIDTMGQRFQTGFLAGKLANLGDDIPNGYLKSAPLAVFKKVVTGETLFTDVKGTKGFNFTPHCTLVFSCNEFPRLEDSTEGTLRRLFPIPFTAHFKPTDETFDPRLGAKLCTERAARYFLRLGIEGLGRVIEQNGFTPNDMSLQLLEGIRRENSSVLEWLEAECFSGDYFEGMATATAYDTYREWCENSTLKPLSRPKFTKEVKLRFGYDSEPRRGSQGRSERTFVRKG